MPDPTAEFFESLNRRGHESLLEEATGTVRFDLEHDRGVDHWLVAFSRGDLGVSRQYREADTVITTTKEFFDRLARGVAHQYTAWVRNELRASGDIRLARLIQRILPGTSGGHHPRAFAAERRQHR